jgi:hypothetical protein
MKKTTILVFALALVLGAATIIYACGNSGKTDQASAACGSSCTNAAKTSQVSATNKSSDAKVITADSKVKDDKTMSSGDHSACMGTKTGSASACPYMKDGSSAKQTKTTKVDDSAKTKVAKSKVVQTRSSDPALAATQE